MLSSTRPYPSPLSPPPSEGNPPKPTNVAYFPNASGFSMQTANFTVGTHYDNHSSTMSPQRQTPADPDVMSASPQSPPPSSSQPSGGNPPGLTYFPNARDFEIDTANFTVGTHIDRRSSPMTSQGANRVSESSRPGPNPVQTIPTPPNSHNIPEVLVSPPPHVATPLSGPDRSTISGSKSEDSSRGILRPQEPLAQKVASKPVAESVDSTPQLRHVIIVAEDAKKDLKSRMNDIATILERGGIERNQWIAQVGFDQQALSRDRNFEYQEEIVITILSSSARAKAIKVDEICNFLPSYIISVRLPSGEILKKKSPALASQDANQRRRGGNFENVALGKLGDDIGSRNLSVLPRTPSGNPCIEVRTLDKLSQNDTVVEVTTDFGFDIKKTGNESSVEFHKLSFTGPQLPENPFHIQYAHIQVAGDGTGTHRAIQYPENQPGHGDEYKIIKGKKTFSSFMDKITGKFNKTGPEFGLEHGVTRGKEDQEGGEWTRKRTPIHHEEVDDGWKLKFDTSSHSSTAFQPSRKPTDSASNPAKRPTVADFSLGYLVGPAQEEKVTVKVTSLWALPAAESQVPKTANLLKRIGRDKGKGRNTESLPMYTNFVHLVEMVFPSNFSGTIPNYKSVSPGAVDFAMPTPREGR